ncbi:MAG: RNA methyltransferase [Bacteroidia bacterium]|nr:RNA methyltransferase [Bacteroidia bacterium]
MVELISSFKNPLIKNINKLSKSKERKEQNLITIEGLRECYHAIHSGFNIKKIIFCSKHISEINLKDKLKISNELNITDVSPEVFDSLVYRKGIENCLAIAEPVFYTFQNLNLPSNPLILIIDSVEKPGNMGAMLRTCDAAGTDAVIVTDSVTDLYNPNCIRASLGAVFTQKIILSSVGECIDWLKSNKISTYLTYLDSSDFYYKHNFTSASAIVVGSEANGINKKWLEHNFNCIKIPQKGAIDSMNVSNSASVILYEAIRQRNIE